jgi:hypothetical protein
MRTIVGRANECPRRSETQPFDAVGSGQLQPRDGVGPIGIRPLGHQQPDRALEPPDGGRHYGLTGPVEPLRIVDGDQQRGVCGEAVEYRGKGGRNDVLLGGLVGGAGSQQYVVDGEALYIGKLGEDGRVNIAEEIRHCRIGEHRLRLAYSRAEHPKSVVARLLDRR